MMKTKNLIQAVLFLFCAAVSAALFADDAPAPKTWTSGEAWSFLKNYQYGNDWKPLLLIEDEVDQSTAAPESKKAMAAKLAAYLTDESSYPCRQFVCMQLRLVGGAAEVPALEKYFDKPEETENVRLALEVIPGNESLAALRKGLSTFKGTALIGVVNSLAKRGDAESLPAIVELTKSDDAAVKSAAVYALGKFGQPGLDALSAGKFPVEDAVAGGAILNIADERAAAGNKDAASIYEKYSVESAPLGCRKAALVGLLNLAGEKKNAMIIDWFTGADSTKVKLAAAHLGDLSADEFASISAKKDALGETAKIAFLEIAAEKEGKAILDSLLAELQSNDPVTQATAIRLLGRLGDATALPKLIPLLGAKEASVSEAAAEAIRAFPNELVGPALIDEMKKNTADSAAAIQLLAKMKYYEAINPMIERAKNTSAEIHDAAIDGLSKLADPDDNDLPRLMKLYAHAAKNGYRDKVERAIVVVCKDSKDAAEKIVAKIDKVDGKISDESKTLVLPLLGKLGGEFAHQQIVEAMADANPQIRAAALRAFCNWPDASYAEELWQIASGAKKSDPAARQMALRAYVRVVTLKSDRGDAATLAMLQNAMKAAAAVEDKTLIIDRAAQLRTMNAVEWLAGFLDDPALSEAACASIAAMAHRRELREPNKAAFTPILEKIEKTAKNKSVAEAAKKARLGM